MNRLQEKFEEFDRINPTVYALFKRFAFEAFRAGHDKLSAKFIVERIRWETSVVTRGDRFKINNNHPAYLARKFLNEYPEYRGFFSTREIRA